MGSQAHHGSKGDRDEPHDPHRLWGDSPIWDNLLFGPSWVFYVEARPDGLHFYKLDPEGGVGMRLRKLTGALLIAMTLGVTSLAGASTAAAWPGDKPGTKGTCPICGGKQVTAQVAAR